MKSRYFFMVLAMLMLCALPSGAFAAGGGKSRPAQFAFVNPVQVFPEGDSIKFFRFNMIYGSNQNMNGFDIGLVNRVNGNLEGVQWGAFNWVEGNARVWQWGVVNMTKGQTSGLQLGLVNITGSLNGLQIGLVNVNHGGKRYMKVLPIVNWAF